MSGILPIISNLDDLAEAIADPPANRPIEQAIGLQGRRVCNSLSNAPAWAGLGNPAVPVMNLVCKPYWENEGISPPTFESEFTGGQCPVLYNLSVTYSFADGGCSTLGPFTDTPSGLLGPLSVSRSTNQAQADAAGGLCPGFSYNTWRMTRANGPDVLVNVPRGVSISSVVVTRQDGLPDNCGDSPPVAKPGPSPSPDNPDLPPGEQPYGDPVYGPSLPLPPIIIAPELPDFEISIDPFGGGGGASGLDPGEPGDAVETGLPGAGGGGGGAGDGVAEGEAPPGSEIVGLRLDLIDAISPPDYGDGIYRGGAYIYMGTANGLDQDFGGSQVADGQFFYAEREGLTKWRVAANVGINWSVVPFYREVV